MPSIFERASKKMVKKLGGKDLRPVKSLLDATKFRQLNVLRKNSQSHFWEQPDDVPVGFSLMDILEPSSSVPETVVIGTYLFSDTMALKQSIGGTIHAGGEGSVSGEFAQFCGSTLEIKAVSIPDPKLEILQNRKLLHPEPSFLKECRMRGDNLYVVTEAVELTKDTVLKDNSSVDASGKLSIPWSTYVQGKVQGQSFKAKEKTMSVPQGTVMAYRKKQLLVKEQGGGEREGAAILLISADTKQKTFQNVPSLKMDIHYTPFSLLNPEALGFQSRALEVSTKIFTRKGFSATPHFLEATDPWPEEPLEIGWKINPISPIGTIEEPFHLDFKFLQEEVSQKTTLLAQISKDVQTAIFHSILAMLGDREALCGLMDMLDMDRLGHLDGPGGVILDEVRQGSRPPWVNLKNLLLYLLQALMVLSDSQLLLLAQSMEKRILLHQRELVRSILQPNFKYPWCIPFTLQPQLLAPLQEEDLAITYNLLEQCGLKIQRNNSKSTWDLEAKMPMSALYGTLSLLQQLAEA